MRLARFILLYLLFVDAMQLELKDIKGGVLEQDYSCALSDFPDLSELAEEGGPEFTEPLHFHLRFQRSGPIVELEGQLEAEVDLSCGRCLQRFRQSLNETFVLTFSPCADSDEKEEEVELEADELGLIVYQDETLELAQPLQEQLIMAVPISPVCKGDCQGLCPECGLNRNDKHCRCEKKPFNNKFTALAGIKFKD